MKKPRTITPIEAALSVPVAVKEDIPAEIIMSPITKVINEIDMEIMIYDVIFAAITLDELPIH